MKLFRRNKDISQDTQNQEKRAVSSDPQFFNYMVELGLIDVNNDVISDPNQAMRLATVYRCVDILSGAIASIPLNVWRKKNGYYEENTESGLYHIFNWRASRNHTMYSLLENAVIQIVLQGNAYILPRYTRGDVSELVLLTNGSVVFDKYTNKYAITDMVNGITGTYTADRIIHLKNKSLDGGFTGVSTITYAGRGMGIASNADEETLKTLKSGNKMKGFITGGDIATGIGKYQDTQMDRVKDRLNTELASGENIMRMPAGVDFRQISINPSDAQLLETRKFSVFEICRFFGVHPDKVFAEASSNYKASENSQVTFLTDTLQPLLTKIVSELKSKLIPKELINSQTIAFDLSSLYQTDLVTKANYYKTMVEVGALTPNDVRLREYMQPTKHGDVSYISCNVAPMGSPKINGEQSSKPDEKIIPEKKEQKL